LRDILDTDPKSIDIAVKRLTQVYSKKETEIVDTIYEFVKTL